MTQIWQSSDWPRFTYDAAGIEPLLLQLTHRIGELQGLRFAATGQGSDDDPSPLTADLLREWYREITGDQIPHWRTRAHEVAVPAARVPEELAAFLAAIGQGGLPAPIRAAVACLWVDQLQPFDTHHDDIRAALVRHILPTVTPAIIATPDYSTGWRQVEDGIDVTEFVSGFLAQLVQQVDSARIAARFDATRNRFFKTQGAKLSPRADRVMRAIFAAGAARVGQGVSARDYAQISGASPATATRDLVGLAHSGVLRRSESGGRSTVYYLEI